MAGFPPDSSARSAHSTKGKPHRERAQRHTAQLFVEWAFRAAANNPARVRKSAQLLSQVRRQSHRGPIVGGLDGKEASTLLVARTRDHRGRRGVPTR